MPAESLLIQYASQKSLESFFSSTIFVVLLYVMESLICHLHNNVRLFGLSKKNTHMAKKCFNVGIYSCFELLGRLNDCTFPRIKGKTMQIGHFTLSGTSVIACGRSIRSHNSLAPSAYCWSRDLAIFFKALSRYIALLLIPPKHELYNQGFQK